MLILQVVGANASPGINKCLQQDGTLLSTIHQQMSCLSVDAVLMPELDPDLCFQPTFFDDGDERNERAASATGNTCLGTTSCVLPQCNSKEGTEDGISMRELLSGTKESKKTYRNQCWWLVSRLKIGRFGRRRWVHTLKSEDDQDEGRGDEECQNRVL